MMSIETAIGAVRLTAEKLKLESPSEADTRTLLIEPLLASIGWDVTDPDVVKREVETHGKFLDIALYIDSQPKVFVEAKALGKNLDDRKFVLQANNYASSRGVEWCILTDGLRYRVFNATAVADLEKKLLFEVSLSPEDEEAPDDLAKRLQLLSPEAISAGRLSAFGTDLLADQRVRSSLQKLMASPPPALIKLMKSELGEPKISPETLEASLKRLRTDLDSNNGGAAVPKAKTSGSHDSPSSAAQGSTFATHTDGKSTEIVALAHTLDKALKQVDTGVSRKVTKMYIAYKTPNKAFAWAVVQRGSIRVFLQIEPTAAILARSARLRDVRDVGHFGGGQLEFRLTDATQMQDLDPLIDLAYSSVSS